MTDLEEKEKSYREAQATYERVQIAYEKARKVMPERLKTFRDNAHKELKAIRVLEQKTKRSK